MIIYNGFNLLKYFGLMNSLEILYILEDSKPVSRILIHIDKLIILKKFCFDNNLVYVISDYQIISIKDKNKGGISNNCVKVPLNFLKKGEIFVYLSKKMNLAIDSKRFNTSKDNVNFGKSLGYPNCCVEFHNKFRDLAKQKQSDYILFALDDVKEYNFYLNYSLRSFGITLISHFPCSLECKNSIEIGKKNLEIIKKYSPNLCKFFISELSSFIIYTEYDGIFYSNNYQYNEVLKEIKFNEIKGSIKNYIYDKLVLEKKVKINSFNSIIIGDLILRGENIGILIFK